MLFQFYSLSPFPSQGPPPFPSGPKLENICSEEEAVQVPPDLKAVTTHKFEGKRRCLRKRREISTWMRNTCLKNPSQAMSQLSEAGTRVTN